MRDSIGRMAAATIAALTFGAVTAQATTIIDLTSPGSEGTANGALYVWTDFQATGTGVIDTFVRVQNNGTELGYNHGLGHNVPWDTKAGIHTHDIQYQDLVTASIAGVDYFQFLLDVNESSGHDNEFISLDNVQIFVRDTPIDSADESLSHLGTQVFNSDVGANGDTSVSLDYSTNSGSGSGDMFLYVPVSLFAGTAPEDYIYFYSQFGTLLPTDAGFEEWGLLQSETGGPENPVVPEPGTMILLGTGLMLAMRKFRNHAA